MSNHREERSLLASVLSERLQTVTLPDLWQQEAVHALRQGHDVVVQAPTGSGKTLIFELWAQGGRGRGQAIYTVPTRALANDKLAEWRARGWNAGIATGDLAENLSAPDIVATLETQKNRLIQGDGPALLVIDEYQMLGDDHRGLNYELAIALAPPGTQLLLLSGSVANPRQIVQWLGRLGRKATLIEHSERPVPLEEVFIRDLHCRLPKQIRSPWARVCARALVEDLGPILLFAPRRQQAEILAAEIARELPLQTPLTLTDEQRRLVGEPLARMLKARVAFHHSGLSYGARAGVVEPLAKAGQLRVVVATMGLAAGINFSLRSVGVTASSYKRDGIETPIRGDELLQMFGRAGRRGIDETGFVLVASNDIRMREGQPGPLARTAMVDWSALLTLMHAAAEQGRDPFQEAVRVQSRLFTTKPIFLGVESSLEHPNVPCGLSTDAERARHVRRRVRLMRNSRGDWEPLPSLKPTPLGRIVQVLVDKESGDGDADVDTETTAIRLRPVLNRTEPLEKIGTGKLVKLGDPAVEGPYGRSMVVADRIGTDRVQLAKWVRRLTEWQGRLTSIEVWHSQVAPDLANRLAAQKLPVIRFEVFPHQIVAYVRLDEQLLPVPVDSHGMGIWQPILREIAPPDCVECSLQGTCRELPPGTGTALLWKRLGLVDAEGVPTRRGRVVSFFSGGDGLAVAAALEAEDYPLQELIYDLANLDAGFRFCGDDNRWEGRLPEVCRARYGLQSIPGYLENGVPPKYGFGAHHVVQQVQRDPFSKNRFVTDLLGTGDIDRILIEWRSFLRQICHHPTLSWPRWEALQALARETLQETTSPTMLDLPPLEPSQTRRIDHRLHLSRHG